MIKINSSEEADVDQSTIELLSDVSTRSQSNIMPWDNSDPFFSAYARDLIQKVLKCYIRQLIVFVGIPGNIISCLVFYKQGISDRINLLLFWLAVADLTNLVAQLLLMPGCYFVDPIQAANWNTIGNAKTAFVAYWSNFVTGTLIVIVSVDRCLSVALPFKAKTLFSYRSMMAAILLSYLVPLVFFFPSFVAFTITWRPDPSGGRTIASLEDTPWLPIDSKVAVDIMGYFSFISKPVFLVTVVICCIITTVSLRRAVRARSRMVGMVKEEEGNEENRITKMLLFLCCVYVILVLPDSCSVFAMLVSSEFYVFKKYHNTVIVTYQLFWFLSCVNSAINFIAYLLLSSRYRKTLTDLTCCPGQSGKHQRPGLICQLGNVL